MIVAFQGHHVHRQGPVVAHLLQLNNQPAVVDLTLANPNMSVYAASKWALIGWSDFGRGRVFIWDEGEMEIRPETPADLRVHFAGLKLTGTYRLRRMRWYPGNRWILSRIDP